jgi:hypothetical protein
MGGRQRTSIFKEEAKSVEEKKEERKEKKK